LRLGVSEWRSNNQQLSSSAHQQRHVSTATRQEVRSLRNHTGCKQTRWDENATSRRLGERLGDVGRWKDVLDSCAQKVDAEMDALTRSKERTELDLAAIAVPLEVSTECLALREGRQGSELVLDPVEERLKEEVELMGGVQRRLQQHVHQAFEQLLLQEVRHQLTSDLQNKMEALDIDMSCLSLTIESPHISLKPNPSRTPSSSTPQEWLQFSHLNVTRAHEALQASQQLREDTSLSRAQIQNELEAHRRATEFALRKRTHAEEQARAELQWQIKKQTEEEMAEMESDIRGLDADLQAKMASLKLAHTRLETRTRRPGMDLCRDEQVQRGLVAEVQQLEATIQSLEQKLSEALSLQEMKLHHSRMLQDLCRKLEALSLEQRCMDTRARLAPTSGTTENAAAPLVPLMNSSGRS
uniref:Tektin n=1 Tax=Kryptolebias marmoratus TaxID=37003 RepID=A0A3Q2ZNW0_KRYMA